MFELSDFGKKLNFVDFLSDFDVIYSEFHELFRKLKNRGDNLQNLLPRFAVISNQIGLDRFLSWHDDTHRAETQVIA